MAPIGTRKCNFHSFTEIVTNRPTTDQQTEMMIHEEVPLPMSEYISVPDPARPMKCPDPMLLAKSEAPTWKY